MGKNKKEFNYKILARPKDHYIEILKKRYGGWVYDVFASEWRLGSYSDKKSAEEAIEAAQYPNKIDFEFVIEEY